uniref:Uncharacterized protein n=1 Tax=Glossina pallidipes TaxID=7398 RepID=A0A1A9Z723_GLOPL
MAILCATATATTTTTTTTASTTHSPAAASVAATIGAATQVVVIKNMLKYTFKYNIVEGYTTKLKQAFRCIMYICAAPLCPLGINFVRYCTHMAHNGQVIQIHEKSIIKGTLTKMKSCFSHLEHNMQYVQHTLCYAYVMPSEKARVPLLLLFPHEKDLKAMFYRSY